MVPALFFFYVRPRSSRTFRVIFKQAGSFGVASSKRTAPNGGNEVAAAAIGALVRRPSSVPD